MSLSILECFGDNCRAQRVDNDTVPHYTHLEQRQRWVKIRPVPPSTTSEWSGVEQTIVIITLFRPGSRCVLNDARLRIIRPKATWINGDVGKRETIDDLWSPACYI